MSRSLWLAACLIAVTVGAQQLRADAAEKIAAGDAALAKFDLDGAAGAYREARELAPTDYESAWKLARALVDKGTLTKDRSAQKNFFAEAEQLAREAIRLDPKQSKGHTYLAIAVGKLALFEGGKRKVTLSDEVKAEVQKAIALDAQDDLAYHVLGIWNREVAELNWVLRTFAELLYGKLPEASLDAAITNLRRAAELAPDVVPHQVELGITLADARKWADAKAALDRALAMPKAWVTDDYYKDVAKRTLERVNAHLK
jgi:tetratricopeptide (TPR) repeat protein